MANTFDPTNGSYTISTLDDLKAFRDAVNDGNSFAGKTITLVADIDLNNEEWTPIGTSEKAFSGTFDGGNHTISNLKITGYNSNVGFFGKTTNGEVKNFTLCNADVSGRLAVGAVCGQPYTSKYTNITLTGNVQVKGMAYVGGMLGRNAYADCTDLTIDAAEGSLVSAVSEENGVAYRTYVGGVIGFMGEGGHTLKNITSNINVEGSTVDVGGIVGIAHYGNKLENVTCTADKIILTNADPNGEQEIGGIAGVWHNESGTTVTMTNCSVSDTLQLEVQVGGVKNDELTAAVQDNALTGAPYSATGTGTLAIPVNSDYITSEIVVMNNQTLTAATANLAAVFEVTGLKAGAAREIQLYFFEAGTTENGVEITVQIGEGVTSIPVYLTQFANGTYDVQVKDLANLSRPVTEFDGVQLTNGTITVEKGGLDIDNLTIGKNSFVKVTGEAKLNVTKASGNYIQIEDGATLKDSYVGGSIDMLGDLEIDGGLKLTGGLWASDGGELSGDTLTASYAMFQKAAYTISADLELVYGYLSYGGTFDVYSTIHTTCTNGEPLYVRGTVNLKAGGKLKSDGSIFLDNAGSNLIVEEGASIEANGFSVTKATATLTIAGTATAKNEVSNAGTITIMAATGELNAKSINGNVIIDAAGFTGTDKVLNLNASSMDGKVTIINKDDDVKVFYRADGDIILSDASMDKIYVSADWAGKEFGDDLGAGMAFGINSFETLAEAKAVLGAVGGTIELVTEAGSNKVVSGSVSFANGINTITGEAAIDWSKGWFFIGRGTGAENGATVIFDGASITSASDSKSYGFHVSGEEAGSSSKKDGVLKVLNGSDVEVDYLINRGEVVVDNAELTVKNGFGIAGRPASETVSGEKATASITLQNNATVIVNNENGMGIGTAAAVQEGYGVLNVKDSTLQYTSGAMNVSGNGIVNLDDNATLDIAGGVANKGTINVTGDNVDVNAINNTGRVFVTGGELNADAITGNGQLYVTGDSELSIAKIEGAAQRVRFGQGYDAEANQNTIPAGVTHNVTLNKADWDVAFINMYNTNVTMTDDVEIDINSLNSTIGNTTLATDGVMDINAKGNAWLVLEDDVTFDNGTFNVNGGWVTVQRGDKDNKADEKLVGADASLNLTGRIDVYEDLTVDGTLKSAGANVGYKQYGFSDGATLKVTGKYESTGNVNIYGYRNDDVANESGEEFCSGATTGIIESSTLDVDGGELTVKGNINNSGTLKVTDGTADITGKVISDGKVAIDDATFTAAAIENTGVVEISGDSKVVIDAMTGDAIEVLGGSLTDSKVKGDVIISADEEFKGDNIIDNTIVIGGTTTVNNGASLTGESVELTSGFEVTGLTAGAERDIYVNIVPVGESEGQSILVHVEEGATSAFAMTSIIPDGTYDLTVIDANIYKLLNVEISGGAFAVNGGVLDVTTFTGSFDVTGKSTVQIDNYTRGTMSVAAGSTLVDTKVAGAGTVAFAADSVTYFEGENAITAAINGATANFDLVVNEGASLLISRYVLGYDRDITVKGLLTDATAMENADGQILSLKANSTSGFSINGWGTSVLDVTDAYVDLDNSSIKGDASTVGTYTWNFKNSYVKALSFGNCNDTTGTGSWTITLDDSKLVATNYIKNGVGVTTTFQNGSVATTGSMRIEGTLNIDATSSVVVTAYQNNKRGAQDEHGDFSGTLNLEGTLDITGSKLGVELYGATFNVKGGTLKLNNEDLILDAASSLNLTVGGNVTTAGSIVNGGTITVDATSLLTAAALTNNGTIYIDAKGYTGDTVKVIDLSQNGKLTNVELTDAAAKKKYYLVYGDDGDVILTKVPETIYVSSDYNSSTDGYGHDKFSNYDSAVAFVKNYATKATVIIEKTNTLSGNCFQDKSESLKVDLTNTYIVKDGAVVGNSQSKWDMTYAVTIEGGGVLQSVRPASAGYGNTHIKNKLTLVGDAAAGKRAQIWFINGKHGVSYKTMSIALLYAINRSITADYALIEVGDLGLLSKASFTNTILTIDGILAAKGTGSSTTTMTDTTVTIKGHNLMNENTYYSTVGTILSNLTMDNTSIVVDDGVDGTVAEKVWLGYTANKAQTLTMTNGSSITVELGTEVLVGNTVMVTDSTISVGGLDAAAGSITLTNSKLSATDIQLAGNNLSMDINSTVAFNTITGGTINLTGIGAYAGGNYLILDYTGTGAMTADDYKAILGSSWNDGVFQVVDQDLYLTDQNNKVVYVNDAWKGLAFGDSTAEGYFVGYNAFDLDSVFKRFGSNATANKEAAEFHFEDDVVTTGTTNKFYTDRDVVWTADEAVVIDTTSSGRLYLMDTTVAEGTKPADADLSDIAEITIGKNVTLKGNLINLGQALDSDDVDAEGNATRDGAAITLTAQDGAVINAKRFQVNTGSTLNIEKGAKVQMIENGEATIVRAGGTINVTGNGMDELQWAYGSNNYLSMQGGTLNLTDTWMQTGTTTLSADTKNAIQTSTGSLINMKNSKLDAGKITINAGSTIIADGSVIMSSQKELVNDGTLVFTGAESTLSDGTKITGKGMLQVADGEYTTTDTITTGTLAVGGTNSTVGIAASETGAVMNVLHNFTATLYNDDKSVWVGYNNDAEFDAANRGKFILNIANGVEFNAGYAIHIANSGVVNITDGADVYGGYVKVRGDLNVTDAALESSTMNVYGEELYEDGDTSKDRVTGTATAAFTNADLTVTKALTIGKEVNSAGKDVDRHGVVSLTNSNATIAKLTINQESVLKLDDSTVTVNGDMFLKGALEIDYTSTLTVNGLLTVSGWSYPCNYRTPSIKVDTTGYTGGTYKVIDTNGTEGPWFQSGQYLMRFNGDLYVTQETNDVLYVNSAWADKAVGDIVDGGKIVGYNAFGPDSIFNTFNTNSNTNKTASKVSFESDVKTTTSGKLFFYTDKDVAWTADQAVVIDATSGSRLYLMDTTVATGTNPANAKLSKIAEVTIGKNITVKANLINLGQAIDQGDTDAEGNATRDGAAITLTAQDGAILNVKAFQVNTGATLNIEKGAKVVLLPNGQETIVRTGGTINVTGNGQDDCQWIYGDNNYLSMQGGTLNLKDTYMQNGTIAMGDDARNLIKNDGVSTINLNNAKLDAYVLSNQTGVLNLTNGSNFTVSTNGSENAGLIVVDGSTMTTKSLNNTGKIQVQGESTLNIGTLTGEELWLEDGAILKDSTVGGNAFVAGNVTFRGDNKLNMIYDFGDLTDYYGTSAKMEWTVEAGASLYLTQTSERYGLGYGDNVKIYGELVDARSVRDSLTKDDLSFSVNGISMMNGGWSNESNFFVKDAYVEIGRNSSFGNQNKNKGGKYTVTFENSVLDSTRITLHDAGSDVHFTFTNSDALLSGALSNASTGSTITLDNSKLAATGINGTDYYNQNAGTITLKNGSELSYADKFTNSGTLTITGSTVTATTVVNSGTITIDANSLLKADTLDLIGTIFVDGTGYTGGTVKLIDLNGTSALDWTKVVDQNLNGGSLILLGDGDVILTDQDISTVYVNSDWAGLEYGTVLADGKIIGLNAFADTKNAFTDAASHTTFVIADNVAAGFDAAYDLKINDDYAGVYTITGGGDSYQKLNPIFMQDANTNSTLIISNGKFTIGKLIAGNKDNKDTNTASITVKDSYLKAADYTGGAAWWTMWGNTTTTIENSVIGLKDTSALDITTISKGAAGANVDQIAWYGQDNVMHFGSAGTVTITDSTMITGFFQVADRGLTTLDNALLYVGGSLNVGYTGSGTASWSGLSADTYNVDGVATLTVGNGSYIKNINWGGSEGVLPNENIGMNVGGGKAGAVIVTEGSTIAMEVNDVNNHSDGINIYSNGTLTVEDGSAVIGHELSNAGTITVDDATLKAVSFTNTGKVAISGDATVSDIANNGGTVYLYDFTGDLMNVTGNGTIQIGKNAADAEVATDLVVANAWNAGTNTVTVNSASSLTINAEMNAGKLVNYNSVAFNADTTLTEFSGSNASSFSVAEDATLTVTGSFWHNTSTWEQAVANYDIAGTMNVGYITNLSSNGTISGTLTSGHTVNFYGAASITGTVNASGSSVGWPTTDGWYEAGENAQDGMFLSGNASYKATGAVNVYEEATISLKDNASFSAGSVNFIDPVTAGAAAGSMIVEGAHKLNIGNLTGNTTVLFDGATVKAGSSVNGGTTDVRFLGTGTIEDGAALNLTSSKVWVGSLWTSDDDPVISSGMETSSLTVNGTLNADVLWIGASYADGIVDGKTSTVTVDGGSISIAKGGSTSGLVVRQSGILNITNGTVTVGKEEQTIIQGVVTIGEGATLETICGGFHIYKDGAVVTVKDGGKLIIGAYTDVAIRVGNSSNATGKLVLDNGDLVLKDTLNIWSEFVMDYESTITFSDTINLQSTGKFVLDLEGYVGNGTNVLLIDDVNGSWTVDQYKALLGDVWNDKAFSVVDGDLYLSGTFAPAVYVNGNWTEDNCDNLAWGVNAFKTVADAVASGAETITVLGKLSGTSAFGGVESTIEDGTTVSGMVLGGYRVAENSKTWFDTEGDVNLTIEGGSFGSNVIGGTAVVSGSSEHVGDINLTINGGTFAKQVAGGMYHYSSNRFDMSVLSGDVNFVITGGTFGARVYGGNFSRNDDQYARMSVITGDINLTIDSSANAIEFADDVVAGSRHEGVIEGNVNVTVTGLGSNLTFNGYLWGGSSADYYVDGKHQSNVTGSRNLTFTDFSGNFGAEIGMFQSLTVEDGSSVNFTNSSLNLEKITDWAFEYGSSVTGVAKNDFTGDDLSFDLNGFETDADGKWEMFSGSVAGFENAGSVTLGGEVAEWKDGSWKSASYELSTNDDEDKLIISKLA